MNSVYKGKDLLTGRPVVIKLLRADLRNDPQAMARFRREADIARRLTHPQIVQTYDEGYSDGRLVMRSLLPSLSVAAIRMTCS